MSFHLAETPTQPTGAPVQPGVAAAQPSKAPDKPADGKTSAERALDRYVGYARETFERNVKDFSDPRMGSRLFTAGAALLVFNIVFRVFQWAVLNFSINFGKPQPAAVSVLDDLFFLTLCVLSVLMMAGGLFANLYLVWNVQRANRQAEEAARESFRAVLMDEVGQDADAQ